MHGPFARWNMSWRALHAAVELKGGQGEFSTTLPTRADDVASPFWRLA